MKRILAVLLAAMLLVAAIPAMSLAETAANSYGWYDYDDDDYDYDYVKVYRVSTYGGRLNMRSGPGTGYKIVRSLNNGKALKYIRKSGSWYKVRTFSGTTGWVSKKYVKSGAYADVCTRYSGLNYRRGPGTRYAVKGSFPHGTRNLLVTKVYGNWAYCSKNGRQGWCSRDYLEWCY